MKKIILLLALALAALSASAGILVCDIAPDENGHFNCPFIKSGTITWDEASRTLTLDNAVVEHSSETPYDYVYPVRVTENATIVIKGECKLTSTGFVALALDGYDVKNITIQGDGSLYLDSRMRGIFLKCTRLTIKDITLQAAKHIANNGFGEFVALTFDNVNADIHGGVERIGEGITFRNCSITYPEDAYIAHDQYEDTSYGYFIANGNGSVANHIIISRGGNLPGDVNGDGEVNIADVNALIDLILSGKYNTRGDINGDHEVNIADVNALIDIILSPQQVYEYVDLGLPSGTLWATMNVGANKPEEYGYYFAWGETAPKQVCDWHTYGFSYYDENGNLKFTKYNSDINYGTVDNKTALDPTDDAAYVNWGPSWRMPTLKQLVELVNQSTWKWTTLNGVNGLMITGPNGNSIFLPAGGRQEGNSIKAEKTCGYFWSRTLSKSMTAVDFECISAFPAPLSLPHYTGLNVRAVRAQ